MKTQATHTGAEWSAINTHPGQFAIVVKGREKHSESWTVAYIRDFQKEDEANARLIAAAPALLSALQAGVGNEIPMSEWLAQARAALALATVGQQSTRSDLRARRDQLANDVAGFAAIALLNGDDAIAKAMLRSYLVQFLEADADYCADLGLDDLAEKQRNRATQLKLTNQ